MRAFMEAGDVEYAQVNAALDIDDLIADLKDLKAQGVTEIVGLSGNYRGAKYVALGLPELRDEDQL